MKRLGNLITEENITHDFCLNAIEEAARHKHKKLSVQKVFANIDKYADLLREMILNDTFTPNKYIYEERIENGKLRKLHKPKFFPDTCVHHILIMLIQDKLVKRIDPYAVASIKGRGQMKAFTAIKKWITYDKKGTTYVIKGDIEKFFDNVQPNMLMECYKRFIKDKKYLSLKAKVVYSCKTLPLGNYCSAFDANLLLKEMDSVIRSQPTVKHYVRYMDDFVAFCDDWEKAKLIKPLVEKVLTKYKLKPKHTYQLFRLENRGLDFIGYRFYPNKIILRKRVLKGILNQTKRISRLKIIPVKEAQGITSRLGVATHCYSKKIFNFVQKNINMYVAKDIIRENSRLISYKINGKPYTPKRILI